MRHLRVIHAHSSFPLRELSKGSLRLSHFVTYSWKQRWKHKVHTVPVPLKDQRSSDVNPRFAVLTFQRVARFSLAKECRPNESAQETIYCRLPRLVSKGKRTPFASVGSVKACRTEKLGFVQAIFTLKYGVSCREGADCRNYLLCVGW